MPDTKSAAPKGWTPTASLVDGGRDARERWRENGFKSLQRRQKVVVVTAAAVVLVILASLLVATVRAVGQPPDEQGARPPGAVTGSGSAPAFAAGVVVARLVSSDEAYRRTAYIQDVDPSIVQELQNGFEVAIPKMVASSGVGDGAALRTDPLGYQVEFTDGRLVEVRLWARQRITQDGSSPVVTYPVHDVLMRWNGQEWRMLAYVGSEAGPGPGDRAGKTYTPLPTGILGKRPAGG